MLQRQIRHDAHTFAPCRCGAEPRHIEARGSTSRETCDPFHPAGTRHALECGCGVRTAWLSTLDAATQAWRAHFAAEPTPPPATRHNVVRPLLRLHTHKETA